MAIITLTKGYEKPTTGDRGSEFYPALERNIQRVNDHTHNGVDGEKISLSNIEKPSQTISATWVEVSAANSIYTQNITMPAGLDFDETNILFKITSGGVYTGAVIVPEITRISSTEYTITVNDNTLVLKATYV